MATVHQACLLSAISHHLTGTSPFWFYSWVNATASLMKRLVTKTGNGARKEYWSMLGQVTVEATLRMERQPQDPWLGQDGESYSATPAPQCFMWGPPHRQGRLCATCRLYCRKHGDLKMPIQSEAISWQTYWWSPVEVTCSTGSSREYPSKILTGKVCSKDPSCRLNFELHIHNIDSTGLQRYPPAVAGGETTLCSN